VGDYGGQMTTYNVLDMKENKIVVSNGTHFDVHNSIGINPGMVRKYVDNQFHYKKRYLITRSEETPKVMDFNYQTKLVMKEFNDAMTALKKNYTKEYLSSLKFKCAG
jgi:hypothetical protein